MDYDEADHHEPSTPAWPSFPERPAGLAMMTLLVAMPYLINASSSYMRVALGSADYFIVFMLPPLLAVILAFLLGLWWQPIPSSRPAAAALNVLLRTGVIVSSSLILGFIIAHVLGIIYGFATDPGRTIQTLNELTTSGHAEAVFARIRQALIDGGWGVLGAILGARAIRAFVWPLGPPDPAGSAE
jgi:hypothetical protein